MRNYILPGILFFALTATAQKSNQLIFSPSNYYPAFSSAIAPAIHIKPGQIVHSESVDCTGADKHGQKLTEGEMGNPLTGPFYVDGAEEGDVLAVTFLDIAFTRNYAVCMEYFHPRSLPESVTKQFNAAAVSAINAKWDIDTIKNIATPDKKYPHLKNFKIAAKPFLGCVGVAAKNGVEISSEDAGQNGGNMDFSRITKGATVYLPVFHKGALLFLGDGHAAQGDGELNWAALEISAKYSFSVKVLKNKEIEYPRVEDATYIMAVGLDSSLDVAFKIATKGLLDWLMEDYKLSLPEATQVLGSSVEYKITEVVDPKVEIVAMIKKETLQRISK
jgi:acetamidase/formamidase